MADVVRRTYDRRARFYNAIVRALSFGGDSEYRRRAVAALRLRPGARVLDVGCGTGLNFRWIREAVGPTGMVAGSDIAREMLRQGPEGVRLVQAAAHQPVWRPAAFDAVLSTYVISTLLDEQVVLPMVEALRPGGRLVIVDDNLPPGWYIGPRFMVSNLLRHGWPDLKRATVRALEPHVDNLAVTYCHYGMIFIISGDRR
jgi:ubiquinone/menaquinone biosynthesis C-methylase UbiE